MHNLLFRRPSFTERFLQAVLLVLCCSFVGPYLRAQTTAPLDLLTTPSDSLTHAEPASSSSSSPSSEPALEPAQKPAAILVRRPGVETSFSLGAFGNLTATRSVTYADSQYYSQSQSPAAGVLGSVRQSFRPWLGYSVNLGYTRSVERFVYAYGAPAYLSYAYSNYQTPSNLYEISLSYLAQKRLSPRLTGFASLGAGTVVALPVHRGADALNYAPYHSTAYVPSVDFRPAGVIGVGVDYRFTPRWGLRAEYRGLVYKLPDYGFSFTRKFVTEASQPTVSLTYTLRRKP